MNLKRTENLKKKIQRKENNMGNRMKQKRIKTDQKLRKVCMHHSVKIKTKEEKKKIKNIYFRCVLLVCSLVSSTDLRKLRILHRYLLFCQCLHTSACRGFAIIFVFCFFFFILLSILATTSFI